MGSHSGIVVTNRREKLSESDGIRAGRMLRPHLRLFLLRLMRMRSRTGKRWRRMIRRQFGSERTFTCFSSFFLDGPLHQRAHVSAVGRGGIEAIREGKRGGGDRNNTGRGGGRQRGRIRSRRSKGRKGQRRRRRRRSTRGRTKGG